MRQSFAFILLILPVLGKAQVQDPSKTKLAHKFNLSTEYYVNSVRVADLSYVDPEDVREMNIVRGDDPEKKTNGKIYVTLKDPQRVFITLNQIVNDYALKVPVNDPYLFMIDQKVMTDTIQVRVDPSAIISVELMPLSEVKYLETAPRITIVKIATKFGTPRSKDSMIRIRGY